MVTDGPFADTKEALGGFYVIEAPDLDVALRLRGLCPAGNVEVRPVLETARRRGMTALEQVFRDAWAAVVASTARLTGDLDLAEDCAQEAVGARPCGPGRRGRAGQPRGLAHDDARTASRSTGCAARRRCGASCRCSSSRRPSEPRPSPTTALRLVFTCCHPALAREAQVALTLRLVCGLDVAAIAGASS